MLKFYCFLTGDQYALVSQDTPQSKQKVMLLANTLVIPVIMWGIIGFLLSYKVLSCSLATSILVSTICAFLIFLVERIIILSTSSKAMTRFRITLGVVVALIGAIALDEVIFKEDVDHQLSINKEAAAAIAKKNEGIAFDSEHNVITAAEAVVKAKADYDEVEEDVKMEVQGKGSGSKGVGSIAMLHLNKANERKMLWEKTQRTHDSLMQLKTVAMDSAADKAVSNSRDGLLIRIKALFQLVFSDLLMALVYLAFTLFMFCLEFIVVLVKMKTPESNYERRVKLIEEIGQRRMEMLKQPPSSLVDPSYCMPNAIAARQAVSKNNNTLYN